MSAIFTAKNKRSALFISGISLFIFFAVVSLYQYKHTRVAYNSSEKSTSMLEANAITAVLPTIVPPVAKTLDIEAYDKKLLSVANNPVPKPVPAVAPATNTSSSTAKPTTAPKPAIPVKAPIWPAKTVRPNAGALLPFNRIVAYYGNFYSKGMGVLGQYPEDVMLKKLNAEVAVWQAADPSTPVIPAIHYIAVTAQGSAGRDGKYRLRMPDSQIDHAIELAHKEHGIVFLDIQVALSNVQTEVPLLEKYLSMPDVHLGLDPEFSMKGGEKPGSVIGTMSAADINFTANYLAGLVKKNNLPPKILIIHRFTMPMVTNYKEIKPLPEVEIVMDMDGWGFAAKKINTYNTVIYPQPVQFTGFKLFYKNDLLAPSKRMLTPAEILKLTPQPLYIQYQ